MGTILISNLSFRTAYEKKITMLTLLKLQNVGGEKEDLARPQYRCIEDDSNDGCGNMLNTDFALFYEYNVLNNRRLADCDFTASQLTCDKADTFETAQEYAEVCILMSAQFFLFRPGVSKISLILSKKMTGFKENVVFCKLM